MSTGPATVVVTGLGATTPLGGDVASTWSALLAGRSGVRPLEAEWAAELPVRIAGTAAVEPAEVLPKHRLRKLDRNEQFALIAAHEAWAHAGYAHGERDGFQVDHDRLGVVISSGIGGILTTLHSYDPFKEKGWKRVSPFTVPMLMPNGSAGWASIEFGAQAGAPPPVGTRHLSALEAADPITIKRDGRPGRV